MKTGDKTQREGWGRVRAVKKQKQDELPGPVALAAPPPATAAAAAASCANGERPVSAGFGVVLVGERSELGAKKGLVGAPIRPPNTTTNKQKQ